jgi:hypothetical protein
MADVADWADADQRAWPRRSLRDQRAGARRVHDLQVFISAGELDRVACRATEANRAIDLGEAIESRPGVRHPVELAVLAVADYIDAGGRLLADDLVNGPLHPRREGRAVVRLTQFLGVQHRYKISRPRQAAGVRREDLAGAALHEVGLFCSTKDSDPSAERQHLEPAEKGEVESRSGIVRRTSRCALRHPEPEWAAEAKR